MQVVGRAKHSNTTLVTASLVVGKSGDGKTAEYKAPFEQNVAELNDWRARYEADRRRRGVATGGTLMPGELEDRVNAPRNTIMGRRTSPPIDERTQLE